MKHLSTLFFMLITLCVATAALAQDDDGPPLSMERIQEIKAQKSAYLTQKMGLTPEEAQRFWPIYNQFDDELEAARMEHRQFLRTIREKKGELSEKEANEILDREIAVREKDLEVRKKYAPRLRKAISPQKLVQLHMAERDFHREVMRRYRDKDKGEGPRGGPGRHGTPGQGDR